jgi:hypothetical protein
LIGEFIPLLTLFIIFTTFTLGRGEKLTAAVAFTSLSIVETLRQQFKWMSEGTKFFTQSRIACQRIDNYLTTAEVQRPVNGPAYFHNATFRRSASKSKMSISNFRSIISMSLLDLLVVENQLSCCRSLEKLS